MLRRFALLLAVATCAVTPAAFAQVVFAVTEGVTYQATPKEIREKFEPIAELIGKALRRDVRVVLVPGYDDVRVGLAKQEYDIAYIHPAHVSLAEVKAKRYRTIAWTSGFTEYTVSLLVNKDSTMKSLGEIRGKTLVTPDPDSITAWMVRAMLRGEKLGEKDLRVRTTRYQDAVPFYIDHDFADVGATAANAVVKAWTSKGGKVAVKSQSVPIKQIIASSKLPADDFERVREVLLTLPNTEPGRKALAASGYKGFQLPNAEVEATSIVWLGL
ncbi:MAG TPA: PhnD/SsuA/transferrin family substrate-binding protein [Casimicrobiaceae bacterium]|nr:PhnD/SsuA/transferrin family substrate-binding protein [Casimicrobiaceae bacterium]